MLVLLGGHANSHAQSVPQLRRTDRLELPLPKMRQLLASDVGDGDLLGVLVGLGEEVLAYVVDAALVLGDIRLGFKAEVEPVQGAAGYILFTGIELPRGFIHVIGRDPGVAGRFVMQDALHERVIDGLAVVVAEFILNRRIEAPCDSIGPLAHLADLWWRLCIFGASLGLLAFGHGKRVQFFDRLEPRSRM